MNWETQLASALSALDRDGLAVLDDAALALARRLQPQLAPRRVAGDAMPQTPAVAALVVDALDGLESAAARARLAHVQRFIAPHVLVVAGPRCPLHGADFIALGFERIGNDPAAQTALYRFDIRTYKPVPDWLNARFWAHPERWEP
jgi:hypothetical protein